MTFLSSFLVTPLFLAFLGLIPVVVLLYLLKLRRTQVTISSTMLWMKSLQDLTANAPFQRLRKNLLLFLQILILLLLIFGLARPFVRAEGTRGNNLCLIIDRSASMQTREDNGETRLALAKKRGREVVDKMESGDRMMVVSFADSAKVLCELTDDRKRLARAVDSVEASDSVSRLRDVMMIVRSLAPDDRELASVVSSLELLLLSDGQIGDLEGLGGLSMNMDFLRIGKTDDNAGIVRFSVRRAEEGAGERQAFVLVHNERADPLEATVTLSVEGSTLAVEEIEVPAKGRRDMLFALPGLEEGLLKAELDVDDRLAVDNVAWLSLQPASYVRVLLVTDPEASGAYFLRRVLSLDPRAEVDVIAPKDYLISAEYDLTIFNGWHPGKTGTDASERVPERDVSVPVLAEENEAASALALPPGTLVFVGTLPPIPGLGQEGTIPNPPILGVEKDHPVMRFLNPENVRIAEAPRLSLPEGARTLISTDAGALVADISTGTQQMLLVGFDVGASNWPLHLSFPLFVQNLISWVPRSGLGGEIAVAVGDPIELLPDPELESVTVRPPDGGSETVALAPARAVYYGRTEAAGPYTITRGDETYVVAVNLLDTAESRITPADTLSLGRTEIAAQTGPVQFNRELWRWLLAAALAVLSIEWAIYCRRAYL